ncbi:MAG TPA: hypothetical protein VN088_06225 [Nocardioides sp.]|nr:hypothetical protein [Nocardioides sp.]
MKRRRVLDWRLFLAISLMLLVGFVVWSGANAAHRADDALATMQQHDQAAQIDRAAAAQDRRTAAANQKALLDYTAALAARQDALLAYLRAHGIRLPARLVTTIAPPRIVVRHHRAHHHRARRHRTTSSSSSTPAGPGKSSTAPGHHKHPRHGRRHR